MKKRRLLSIIIAALIAGSMLTACTSANSSSGTDSQPETSQTQSVSDTSESTAAADDTKTQSESSDSKSTAAVITSDEITSTELFSERDLSGDYETDGSTTITASGTSFKTDGSGAKAYGNVLTISEEGTYILSGSITDGRIVVEADDTAKVQLVLNGFTITCSDYSALYVKSADKVFVTLAKGTENKISDGSTYKDDSEESNVDSAIFSKSDLTINGSGTLTVEGNNRKRLHLYRRRKDHGYVGYGRHSG